MGYFGVTLSSGVWKAIRPRSHEESYWYPVFNISGPGIATEPWTCVISASEDNNGERGLTRPLTGHAAQSQGTMLR